ncbi:DUF1641 domain-containing protein [Pseudomonas mandelii]
MNVSNESITPPISPGSDALMEKLKPLIDGGRLDNLVDLLSLISDLVDLLDPAMVEKLARLFEGATEATWSVSNAVRMAKADSTANEQPPGFYQLKLLREPDTRRGVGFALKTLNVIGRQL